MLALLSLLACGPAPAPPTPAVPEAVSPAEPAGSGSWDGLVWTADGFAMRHVAWADGRFTEVAPIEGEATTQRLTPGLVDAHAHPASLGRQLAELDLVGAATLAETLDRVRPVASGDGWLVGRGWDQNDWSDAPPGGWPTAAHLDAIVDRPAILRRVDGHAAWLNTAALRAARITADTPDPEGGRILRGADGVPTGVLIDNAIDLVPTPPVAPPAREARLRTALQAIADAGLTGVHDMGADDDTIALYDRLDRGGELPIRLVVYAMHGTRAEARLRSTGPWGGDRYRVVGVKALADGALGSRGAWLSAEYADDPGNKGLSTVGEEALAELAGALIARDAQLAVHAIGDAAVRATLDAFARARADHPDKAAVPLRVEHAQVVRPEDLPRFAELGVIASMQPTHATSDMPWAEARLGPERVRWAYRWQDLRAAGAQLAFGSDFPVERVDVALGLWSATTRTDLAGSPAGGWFPDQVVTLDQAIAAFSEGAARAAAQPWSGIAVGAPADLVVWEARDGAPWTPIETRVAGVRVSRPPAASP